MTFPSPHLKDKSRTFGSAKFFLEAVGKAQFLGPLFGHTAFFPALLSSPG